MPDIELQHIVSCSSADKNNPAENLLKCDGTHKWKSLTPGEKSVSCIIQLGKSSQIHSIDIGNEGSAFVEVLVGKATATDDKDFEVLLVASSFMSPLDSRNGMNRTAVRMFGPEDLNKQTSGQSWDRVKIVCTQPFSKTFQYGLSFIKLHSPPSKESEEPKVKKLGAFTIKETDNDDDHDEIHVGSLFANRHKKEPPAVPTGAAAIRMASKHPEDLIKTSLADIADVGKKRQAESPPLAEPQAKTPKQEKKPASDDSEAEEKAKPFPLKKQSTSLSSLTSTTSSTSSEKSALKRTKTEPNATSSAKTFRKIMDRVVFVLSGFQNPARGNLRDMALEMGAKYRPDWGKGCTHLICAFPNTPKYQQVSGKGKIVTKAWIEDCHKQKKLLPWRNYRLGKAPSPPQSSDEEDEPPKTFHKQTTTPKPESLKKNVPKKSPSPADSDSDATDSKKNKPYPGGNNSVSSDAGKNSDSKSSVGKENDPFAQSTDDETDKDEDINNGASSDNNNDSGLPDLPEFFTDKTFFLYGEIEPSEKRLLTRYIAAYNGEVADYMSKSVNFVITTKKWDSNFDTALSENPGLIFVKPKWIHLCHEKNALVPYQHHVIVP